jgi:N-acetylglucosaminyldiphosphoundecaprenol N-acetyl-beta-D-mannosaminyltransferase
MSPTNQLRSMFGMDIAQCTSHEIGGLISDHKCSTAQPRLVVTLNWDHLVTLLSDAEFRMAYAFASIRTLDSMPLYYIARLRGFRVPSRVTGHDLLAALVPQFLNSRHRVFLLPSSQEVLDRFKANILSIQPSCEVEGFVPPYGFEGSETLSNEICRRIANFQPTVVLLGIGAPKSEVFVWRNRERLVECWYLCIGSALNIYCGESSRPPYFLQVLCLEWLWRLLHQPSRMLRRYLVRSIKAIPYVILNLPVMAPDSNAVFHLSPRLRSSTGRKTEGSVIAEDSAVECLPRVPSSTNAIR